MADQVIVMSPRPRRVVGEVRVGLPRPRTQYLRDQKYFQRVDEVVSILERNKQTVEAAS